MAERRRGGSGGRAGPPVGALITGTIVGQAKRGVAVELAGVEVVLERGRYGAADWIDDAGYGTALTLEVVASAPGRPTGVSRVAIERALRQPRSIDGRLSRSGADIVLEPSDGGRPVVVQVLDLHLHQVEDLIGRTGVWSVGQALGG